MKNFCCDSFKKISPELKWFSFIEKGKTICVMPSVKVGETYFRFNYCPSCGQYVRDIQIDLKLLTQL